MPFAWEQPDPNIAAAGAALGDIVSGGPQRRAKGVYVDQYRKNAEAADSMWKARDSRARAIAREGLSTDTLTGAGYDAKVAPLLANVLAAGATPDIRNLGDFADPADRLIDAEREAALKAGDMPRYNRLTALATDKSYQPARIEDGVITPDGVGLGDSAFKVQPLPQTQSLIDQRAASSRATETRADAYADHQRRAPAPRARSSKPEVDADTTMAWITAKANDLAKSGKSDEYVQAYIRNEAAKHGITLEGAATGDTPLGDNVTPVEAREGFVSFDSIPSAARSKLKEGVVTKFKNGQSWSLRNGHPIRVK